MRGQNDFGAVKAFSRSKEEEILRRFTVRIFQNEAVWTILSHFCRDTFFRKNQKSRRNARKISVSFRFCPKIAASSESP